MREKTSFGRLLRHYRQAANLSQEALADLTGLSVRGISDLERGVNRVPRYDTLNLLAGALSLSPSQLDLLHAAARPDATGSDELPTRCRRLPPLPTVLIGREQERAYASDLICHGQTHLLTVTGASGTGKTSLALQLAHDLAPAFADGIVFIALAAIRDATLVPDAVAQEFGLRNQVGVSDGTQVAAFLQNKETLLVLDNVEQIPDISSFLGDLLANCPRLSMLVTSRTPLHLRAERELPLGVLPLDQAVLLFCERARALRPSHMYDPEEVAAVCIQVDCLPLAIELAAMYVRVLSMRELRERLNNRLAVLRGGPQDLPARQQTMEGAIAWSYDLLTAEQQRAYRALGVFVGGWTIASAAAVWGDDGKGGTEETILRLAALVDASLLQTSADENGRTHFRMLEVIREYALHRLRTEGEEGQYRRRHAAYYARLAELHAARFGPGPTNAEIPLLSPQEMPNVRAALEWAEETTDTTLGLQLAAFARYWDVLGQVREAEHWLERMLALDARLRERGQPAAPLSLRIARRVMLPRVLLNQGKLEQARLAAEETLSLARQSENPVELCDAFANVGLIAQASGRLDEAEIAFLECDGYARLTREPGLRNRSLVFLAEIARVKGQYASAEAFLEEALTNAQTMQMPWDTAVAMTLLAHLARFQGNYPLALERYQQGLVLYLDLSSPTYTAWCLEGCAAALCAVGRYAPAVRLGAAAAVLREKAYTPLPPAERDAFEQIVHAARVALAADVFAQEWAAGSLFSRAEAIECALLITGEQL